MVERDPYFQTSKWSTNLEKKLLTSSIDIKNLLLLLKNGHSVTSNVCFFYQYTCMNIWLLSIIDTAVSFSAFCHETVASLWSQNIIDIAKCFFLNAAVLWCLEIKSSDNLPVLQLLWNTDWHPLQLQCHKKSRHSNCVYPHTSDVNISMFSRWKYHRTSSNDRDGKWLKWQRTCKQRWFRF